MLRAADDKQIEIWNDSNLLQIKDLFARDLTEKEFVVFMEMGRRAQLNPFLREIWAVKYDKSKPAQIFIGRDGYRKGAQRHPLYDYHMADAVYANDEFGVDNGRVMHRYKLNDRGKLMGAYSVVKRKDSTLPCYVFAEFSEYNLGRSVWKEKPATMIKKVAEAQALRMAFQEFFAGTYSECEQWDNQNSNIRVIQKNQPAPKQLEKIEVNLDEIMMELSQASTLDELEKVYKVLFRKCAMAGDEHAKTTLRKEKDRKKNEIEMKEDLDREMFIAEMDGME